MKVATESHFFECQKELNILPLWIENFVKIYQSLNKDNLSELAKIYHQQIIFKDPMHAIEGFNNLTTYFESLYQNVIECKFEINNVIYKDNQAAIYWNMSYSHKHLNSGNPILVEGHSFITSEAGKVIYHRDYIDLGQMLYEHIPLLGRIISWIRMRVSA